MSSQIAIADTHQTLAHVSSFFVDEEINGVVIVDGKGVPCGIISKSCIIHAVAQSQESTKTVDAFMSVSFATVKPTNWVENIDFGQNKYVVVWDGRDVLGMITRPGIERIYNRSAHGCFVEFGQFIDHINNPIVLTDRNGWVRLCNNQFSSILEKDKEGVINSRLSDLMPVLEKIKGPGEKDTEQKLSIGRTSYLVSWVNLTQEEKKIGMLGFFYNLTKEEAINERLKQTKLLSLQLDAIIESSFDGIFVTDGEGKVLRVNRAYERITGIKAKEVVGRTMQSLVKDGFYNESVTMKVLESRREVTIIQQVSKMNKTIVVTGNPVFDDTQNIRLVVTNARDVTELSSLQNKLQHMESLTSGFDDQQRNMRIDKELDDKFILASKAMQDMKQLAKRLAKVESTLLIQGESGVGKGVFAQMVHAFSEVNDKPFMQISCAAIPEQLLESELFGYSEGAFTGASRGGKKGLFELADGGYIFLDEIGEMPIALQAKLLRVIQELEFYRVGDPATPIRVNVRIITATNRDLEEMVAQKTFRKDLFYRLNVVPIFIPPLRERRDGIMTKIQAFMKKCNTKYGWSKQIDHDVMRALVNYEWPGNVRELENTIERMAVMSEGDIIKYQDLPPSIQKSEGFNNSINKSLKSIVCEVEKSAIQDALNTYKSTRKAANSLGINQSTIVRKAKMYGLVSRGGFDA
ncbi:sigma 54-interacting transcriptional regulator [Desulfovermiculus halophilus]|uniref:sigma 54-interacting transcriptional regulator n=1 Tax=Desulfovermiculus halophilus TaxID=339722 RepID=UPI001ABF7DEE|nr:sigma 54-interacting transcriptional regulator [Desulfovermiculus halophilus]